MGNCVSMNYKYVGLSLELLWLLKSRRKSCVLQEEIMEVAKIKQIDKKIWGWCIAGPSKAESLSSN